MCICDLCFDGSAVCVTSNANIRKVIWMWFEWCIKQGINVQSWYSPGTVLVQSWLQSLTQSLNQSWYSLGTVLVQSCYSPGTVLVQSWYSPVTVLDTVLGTVLVQSLVQWENIQ